MTYNAHPAILTAAFSRTDATARIRFAGSPSLLRQQEVMRARVVNVDQLPVLGELAPLVAGPEFDNIAWNMDINAYPKNVQTLARHARNVLREWLPRAKETEDTPARMFAYAYGPGYRGVICTLILSKSGVKLGIPWGASFPDWNKVLRGAGKVHRHVPLKAIEDLQQPGIKELVAAASAACKERLGKP